MEATSGATGNGESPFTFKGGRAKASLAPTAKPSLSGLRLRRKEEPEETEGKGGGVYPDRDERPGENLQRFTNR